MCFDCMFFSRIDAHDSCSRGSNQRGYVLHQTNEVLVEDNVAFDILGHCYFLEDGVEVNNTFRNNLGADVKKATKLLSELTGRIETDNMPSVFWISNAANFL
jgi:nitrous oxidase accessory protein NosD